MDTEIKTGGKLTTGELTQINGHRVIEFQSKELIDPAKVQKDAEDLFFLLKEKGNKLLAFGRLENLEIYFQGKPYQVFCVSTVVATEKGRGYGSMILEEIKKFSIEKGKTLLGFCETSLLPFYRKCGFYILSPEDNKFVYAKENGEIIPDFVPGEVFYIDGGEKILARVLEARDKTVKILRVD